jgi:hypothetical protein
MPPLYSNAGDWPPYGGRRVRGRVLSIGVLMVAGMVKGRVTKRFAISGRQAIPFNPHRESGSACLWLTYV